RVVVPDGPAVGYGVLLDPVDEPRGGAPPTPRARDDVGAAAPDLGPVAPGAPVDAGHRVRRDDHRDAEPRALLVDHRGELAVVRPPHEVEPLFELAHAQAPRER